MDWNNIRYFKEEDFRPQGYTADFNMGMGFLLKLDILGSQINHTIKVHKNGGFAVDGHSKDSLHYMGLAADINICSINGMPVDPIHQALLVYKWTFLSIGIYCPWGQGIKTHTPGLHVDDRTAIGLEKKVWFQDPEGINHTYSYNDLHHCLEHLILCRKKRQICHELQVA